MKVFGCNLNTRRGGQKKGLALIKCVCEYASKLVLKKHAFVYEEEKDMHARMYLAYKYIQLDIF